MHAYSQQITDKKYMNCIFVQYEKMSLFPEEGENNMVYMYNVG